MPDPPSPERRSAADLQRILDSLIGDAGFVLSGHLPEVLSKYETAHDLTILDPAEYDGLRQLCSMHSDMELGPEEMFQFLKAILKSSPARSPPATEDPVPGSSMSASQSLPPSSFRNNLDTMDQTTPKQNRQHRRRNSDRIRSPSDSSGTSSEDDQLAGSTLGSISGRRSFERQISAPPASKSFPAGLNGAAASIPRPPMPRRPKTLSDPHMDSPLAARMSSRNAAGPPSAFGNFGSFARPSPASRRRRGSTSQYGSEAESEQEDASYRPIGRSMSSKSISNKVTSPTWPHSADPHTDPVSPISPDGVDVSPFHARAKSPESVAGSEHSIIEVLVEDQGGDESMEGADEDMDETEDTLGDTLDGVAMNPRLSRLSTGSSLSLRTSHDKLQKLQKQNTELARKLKESERQLSLLGADNDRMVLDLERQLEETRHELAMKRKEDKDLKNSELNHKIQISGLEADLANLQRSLEQSKENRASMQKMYDSQCDEAQRLRDMLRDRDAEIHALEEAAQEHEADEEKFSAEIQSLEAEVKRLETDLESARKAESVLETQKQENLQLKETIDRMRFDLDEARAAAANALKVGGHARVSTSGSSGAPTLSRNLGEEINRRLADATSASTKPAEDHEDDEDDVVETVVTTRQTRKRGSRAPSGAHGTSGSASVPTIRLEEDVIREYADVAVATDPVEERPIAGPSTPPHEHPPAYTAEAQPVNPQDVLDKAHPSHDGLRLEATDPRYEALVASTGVRCTVLEEELRLQGAGTGKALWGSFPSWPQGRQNPRAIVNHIIYNTQGAVSTQIGMVSVCTVAAFAIGLMTGTHLLGTPAGIHPRDYLLFSHMNDLARSVGSGEGFLPNGAKGVLSAVGTGAGMLAGRVPS